MNVHASSAADNKHNMDDKLEEVWGIYHDPMEFVQKAAETGHPQNLRSCLPKVLRRAAHVNANASDVQRARSRTELIMTWKNC